MLQTDSNTDRGNTPVIRVMILEDDTFAEQAMRDCINDTDGMVVVASCDDPATLIERAASDHPDVVVIDLRIDNDYDAGLSAMQELRKSAPHIKFVVHSGYLSPTDARDVRRFVACIDAGAQAIVQKAKKNQPSLIELIRLVTAGREHYDLELVKKMRQYVNLQHLASGTGEATDIPMLSAREMDVLNLVAENNGDKEIAQKLHISINTVKTHVKSINATLGVHSRQDAVRFAIALALLPGPVPTPSASAASEPGQK